MNEQQAGNMRTFYIIWFGQLISTIGSGLTGFALGIWIYQQTGSVTLFALNLLAFSLPNLILSPITGLVADRFDRRLVMISSDALAGLSSLAIGLLYWLGALEIWHIYLATVVNAGCNTLQYPAYTAATTLLVPKDKLGNASGMVQISEALAQLFAPAVAGALFLYSGLAGILIVDFVTFFFAVFTLAVVRFPQPEKSEAGLASKEESVWHNLTFGWRYLWKRPGLLGLLAYFAAFNLISGMISPLLSPMLLDMSSPDVVGYVASAIGMGMLIGTIAMSAWGGPKRRIIGVLLFGGLSGLTIAGLGASSSIWMITLFGFLAMLLTPVMGGSSQALWQVKVEPDVQGRVFAVRRMIAWSTTPIAFLVAGPLADRVFEPLMAADGPLASTVGQVLGTGDGRGTGLLFVVLGLLCTTLSIVAYLNPRVRLVEDELADVLPDESQSTEMVEGQGLPQPA